MRTATSPKTGIIWRLCCWNDACQMPVSTRLTEASVYCPWHQRCLHYPQHAGDFEAFATFLEWFQSAYPSDGVWGWPAERIWPVCQGVETIWHQEAAA